MADIAETNVLCVGDIDIDLFVALPEIPGFDQKVGGRHLGQMPGGMSANSAVAFTRLGHPARLMAAIGDDAGGREALLKVAAEGVDVSHVVKREGVNSFTCVVLLSPSAEKSLIRLETDAYLPSIHDIQPEVFDGIRHVHVTYGDAALTEHVLREAHARGLITSLDLEPPDIRRAPDRLSTVLRLVDTLFVNREGWLSVREALGAPLHSGMLKRGGEIILTMGADGCRHIDAHMGSPVETIVPGLALDAIDTTGAGDCFAAAYIARKLEGAPLLDRLRFANAAAALATMAYGAQTAMPRREDVDDLLKSLEAPLMNAEGPTHA
jgi:ribokinase